MAASPIDLDHLARYTGGDKALNTEILRLFNGQLGTMVGELLTVLEQRDARKWRQVTHTIKGAARGVGANALGDVCAKAEAEGETGLAAVKAALDAAVTDIAAYQART